MYTSTFAIPPVGRDQYRAPGNAPGSLPKHSAARHIRTSRITLISLYCLALLSTRVLGQGTYGDARARICYFENHQAVVVNSTLFVDGGEWAEALDLSLAKNNNTARQVVKYQNEYLWKLDLKKPFAAQTPPWELKQKPSDWNKHYNGAEGTIWNVGMETFITIGGWFSPRRDSTGDLFGLPYTDRNGNTKLPEARMFIYNVASEEWTSLPLDTGLKRVSTASMASSKRKRRGYVLGGLFILEEWNGLSYPAIQFSNWLSTMSQYDFVEDKWKTEDLPKQIGGTVDGGLIALDSVGEDGVLVFLGGQERLNGSEPTRSMETIWIYDIATSKWYSQITTGEIPVGRRRSCFFMVPAPDQSSYQIYTFAGVSFENSSWIGLLDLYVLTVPGFIWKQVPLTDYPDNYTIQSSRCSPHAKGRQMLIVPGVVNAGDSNEMQFLCNNGTGIKVFDTREWRFTDEFDPTITEIGVPEPITSLIGGKADGWATVKSPKEGWQDKTLGTIFSKRNKPIIYEDSTISNINDTTSTTTPTRTSTPDPTDSASPEKDGPPKLSGGAIAGVAVGVLLGIAFFGGTFFCGSCRGFFRKRDKKEAAPLELDGHRDPVEVAAVVPGELPASNMEHMELGGGYLPAELMNARKSSYENYGYVHTETRNVNGEMEGLVPSTYSENRGEANFPAQYYNPQYDTYSENRDGTNLTVEYYNPQNDIYPVYQHRS